MKTKLGREIKAGDTIIDYHGRRTVSEIVGESTTGSWQECQGGFPVAQFSDGSRDLLVPYEPYEIAEKGTKEATC